MIKEVKDWQKQAQADMKTANDALNSKNYYAAVAFAQQSAEKGLKAVYILLTGKTPPKIHDLVELSRLVNASVEVTAQAEKLTVTYFSSRYPGVAPKIPVEYYTKRKAQRHIKEAEVILQWAEKMIL